MPRSRAARMKSSTMRKEARDDGELAPVPRGRDHGELVVEPLADRGGQRFAEARARPPLHQVEQERVLVRIPRGERELRHEVALLEVDLAELRDPRGVLERLQGVRSEEHTSEPQSLA